MRRGKLIGIGVGPGDPELMTVKAMKALESAGVIAFIGSAGRPSRPREIAASYVKPGVRELVAVMPANADATAIGRAYAQLATAIISELGQGIDVVFLCEGDPLLYGSFAHLVETLGPRFEVVAIPGVSSMSAASAATLRPLAVREQPFAVIPASLPPKRLEAILRDVDRAVILRVGRHLPKVRDALRAGRMGHGATLVENVSLGSQRITPLEAARDEDASPYSLVLASRDAPPAARERPREGATVSPKGTLRLNSSGRKS